MCKMFYAFLGGAPGTGLLLSRLCTAFLLSLAVFVYLSPPLWLDIAVALLAFSLAAGFAVRVAASLAALVILFTATQTSGPLEAVLMLQALQAVALALLGAGAYSVDARLFGRRVIQLKD
jgi:hypothetical protein